MTTGKMGRVAPPAVKELNVFITRMNKPRGLPG
jgi:hypothetical protein